eukprot:TRINITY_DN1106_c1_g1_i2.p1 TRINITY_DN1106_c1_g1~~TRINITY_DN1106_c1_g1_i2.p1  ORF type:complete len:730 (+),score=242.95 TRINITY_DN1106_c1_g1_i2:61-2190(+)
MPGRKRKVEDSEDEESKEQEESNDGSKSDDGSKSGKDSASEDNSGSDSSASSSSTDDKKKKKPKAGGKKGKRKPIEDSDDEKPAKKKGKAAKKPAPKTTKKKKEEEEEPVFDWWNRPDSELVHDGIIKWKTLEQKGPMFAPPYEPHGVPIKYEGKVFVMTEAEEEAATLYAVMRESQHYKKALFHKNFFTCWKEILDKRPEGRKIKELALCNFDAIWEKYCKERIVKKSLPNEEKKKLREKAAKEAEPYMFVTWDGRKEKVANPRIEPPGIFQGRGKHPKLGCLKPRVQPEDVTINVQNVDKPPPAPKGHKWGSVIRDNTVSWLAKWNDVNTGDTKYTMLANSSALKQYIDRLKFEKARILKDKIDDVRREYTKNFSSRNEKTVQMAVAMYFIDILALRVGGEKSEDEADTVGCCSLRKEHITPVERDGKYIFHFDFLGKDSIRYVNDMEVSKVVFNLVKKLCEGKDNRPIKENQLFDLVSPSDLNAHFKSIMDGLSAKVFRTYNASFLLDKIFHEEPVDSKLLESEKMVYFTNANTKVAVLCNHQKTMAKGHEQQKESLNSKVEDLKTTLKLLEGALEKINKAKKNKRGDVFKVEKERYWKVEDKIQLTWLKKYGKEEDLEKYETAMERRKGGGASPKRKRKDDSDSDDDKPLKKKNQKSRAQEIKEEEGRLGGEQQRQRERKIHQIFEIERQWQQKRQRQRFRRETP